MAVVLNLAMVFNMNLVNNMTSVRVKKEVKPITHKGRRTDPWMT